MSDIRTIDSAPKDGTSILGYGHYWWSDMGDQPESAHYVGWVVMCWSENWEEWRTVTNNPYSDTVIPTHWMPLPPPPGAVTPSTGKAEPPPTWTGENDSP